LAPTTPARNSTSSLLASPSFGGAPIFILTPSSFIPMSFRSN